MENVITYLFGVVGLPIIQYAKNQLGLEGKGAMVLSVVVAVLLGAASMFLNDSLDYVAYDWSNLPQAFGQVLIASSIAYKMILKA